jgi:hypothetical protein
MAGWHGLVPKASIWPKAVFVAFTTGARAATRWFFLDFHRGNEEFFEYC